MIITDLNHFESAESISVEGGFLYPIHFTSKVKFDSAIKSKVHLTPFTSSATAEADALAAPYYIDGASFTQASAYTATGLAGGKIIGGVFVGSVSSATSASATQG
jgi:hypothetical protein